MAGMIEVELVFALPTRQELVHLRLHEGATVKQAVEASGLMQRYPEIDLGKTNKVGIYAKLAKLDTVLRDKDRVEIYRPLIADPKEVRRKRAEEGKVTKKGGVGAAGGEPDEG
jgi:putative ubiquitin-RnfH superfamily antitoxin RatB of RatAB toxin-antitoxin module